MKIVVVGCGKVGRNIAEVMVKEGHDIVLIDKSREVVEDLSVSLDVMGVVGNGASYSTLKEAGIEEAEILLAVTDSDELNMLCCMFARKASNCQTIARVRNPIYYEELNFIRDELGLAMIINPELAAAREIASILSFPSAIKVDFFARGRVQLMSFVMPDNPLFCDKAIRDIKLHDKVLFVGIERKDEVIIPNGNSVIKAGDKITIVSSPLNATRFFKTINLLPNPIRSCLIVGGSTLAYNLARILIEDGIDVTIVEYKKERCEELADLLPKATIICGDGTDPDVLMEEGLMKTDSFVSLTNIDEENILLSMFAKANTRAKVVTKVNRYTYDSVIKNDEAGSLVYPKHVTADRIIQFVRALNNASGNNVETLYQILDNQAEAMSFIIKEKTAAVGIPFENMKLKDNLLVCSILRNGRLITPTGKNSIEIGDYVIIVTTHGGISDITEILE